ncbi:MAG: hypothetical protein ACP5OR_07325 [Candidatus Dormibacteria bacterium]
MKRITPQFFTSGYLTACLLFLGCIGLSACGSLEGSSTQAHTVQSAKVLATTQATFLHCGRVQPITYGMFPSHSPVTASDAEQVGLYFLRGTQHLYVSGPITCDSPKLVDASSLSQYLEAPPTLGQKVWVVMFQGNFDQTSSGPSGSNNPLSTEMFLVRSSSPGILLGGMAFESVLPSPLSSLAGTTP